jgi:hypothetical protein
MRSSDLHLPSDESSFIWLKRVLLAAFGAGSQTALAISCRQKSRVEDEVGDILDSYGFGFNRMRVQILKISCAVGTSQPAVGQRTFDVYELEGLSCYKS